MTADRGRDEKDERARRLGEKLRANLKKRKQQTRERRENATGGSDTVPGSDDGAGGGL